MANFRGKLLCFVTNTSGYGYLRLQGIFGISAKPRETLCKESCSPNSSLESILAQAGGQSGS